MQFLYFILFLLLILGELSSLVVEGPCPDIKPPENFNLTALTQSTLYEIARYPDDWETSGDCVIISFYKDVNGIWYNLTEVVDNKAKVLNDGYLDYDNKASKVGKIDVDSKFFKNTYGKSILTVSFLMVDYNNYYMTYNCKYDETKNVHYDSVWIISTSTRLKPEDKSTIYNFMKSSKFLDADKLVWDVFVEDSCTDHMIRS